MKAISKQLDVRISLKSITNLYTCTSSTCNNERIYRIWIEVEARATI